MGGKNMTSLLIKNMPESLHKRLKDKAKEHRRSMTQETITILEESLALTYHQFSKPVKGKKLIGQNIITKAIKEGRE
jgi:hypothetical protein